MPGSSLRNAVKRITHKERAQPQARSHLGLLQKHGDYKKRADHYHAQQDRMSRLREKAAMRNPDEFYFGMTKAQVVEGKGHQLTDEARNESQDATIGPEAVKVMKSQDLSYVRLQKQRDRTKAQKIKESLHFIGMNDNTSSARHNNNKHTIFVDTQDQADKFDAATHFDTAPELVDRSFNRPRKAQLQRQAVVLQNPNDDDDKDEPTTHHSMTKQQLRRHEKQQRHLARTAAKARSSAYAEYQARNQRAQAMARAEAHLVTERLIAGKGRKRKVAAKAGGKPAQYKWRRKRKR